MEWQMYFAMVWTYGKDFFPTYINVGFCKIDIPLVGEVGAILVEPSEHIKGIISIKCSSCPTT